MKNIFLFFLITMSALSVKAQEFNIKPQSKYGIKLSTGFITTGKESTLLIDEAEFISQKIEFTQASPQFSAGLWAQKKFGWLYADGQVSYTTYGMQYDLSGAEGDKIIMQSLKEKFHYADIQVMGGISTNGFRLGVGPVAHILLKQDSDLVGLPNFNEKARKISYGFSGTVGYDFNRFSLDIRYDKAFRTIGDHMYYGTRKSKFLETPDVLALSVSIRIL